MTTTYQEIKAKQQKAYNELMEKYQVFWAFSNSQLEEGKAKIGIAENKDLYSIGMGGFLPKAKVKDFAEEMSKLSDAHAKKLREAKQAREEAILYELNNHESFYAGHLDPVFEMFEGIYTKDEIKKVYRKFLNQPHKEEDRLETNPND